VNSWHNIYSPWNILRLTWWDTFKDLEIKTSVWLLQWFHLGLAQWNLILLLLWFLLHGADLQIFIHLCLLINAKDIWRSFKKLRMILLLLLNTMVCLVSLTVEQLESLQGLWLSRSITRAGMTVKEIFV